AKAYKPEASARENSSLAHASGLYAFPSFPNRSLGTRKNSQSQASLRAARRPVPEVRRPLHRLAGQAEAAAEPPARPALPARHSERPPALPSWPVPATAETAARAESTAADAGDSVRSAESCPRYSFGTRSSSPAPDRGRSNTPLAIGA